MQTYGKMVSMPTTFWQRIDGADPADDPFSLGLLQLRSQFLRRWAKLELEAIPSCNEERRRALHSKPVPTGSLAGTFHYHAKFREHLLPKLRRNYWLRRDYLNLLTQLERTLLQSAFKGWLSAVRDLVQEHFQDAFEIAAANPDRTRDDDPQEFAYQFLNVLIEGVVKKSADDLLSNDFLRKFFKNPNTRSEKAEDILVLLRELLWVALFRHIMELSSQAQIELAKRAWTKVTKPSSPRAQESEVAPTPATVSGLRLQFALPDLEDPHVGTPRHQIVRYLHQHLKQAIKEARAWCDREDRKGRKPSTEEIAARFPILKAANSSELQYIYQRKTPHQCSINIMAGRTLLPLETITRYLRPMRREEPPAK